MTHKRERERMANIVEFNTTLCELAFKNPKKSSFNPSNFKDYINMITTSLKVALKRNNNHSQPLQKRSLKKKKTL